MSAAFPLPPPSERAPVAPAVLSPPGASALRAVLAVVGVLAALGAVLLLGAWAFLPSLVVEGY